MQRTSISQTVIIVFLAAALVCPSSWAADITTGPLVQSTTASVIPPAPVLKISTAPIHAIHVTAWEAGSSKYWRMLDEHVFKETMVNAVVIDIKEYEGEVYIPGVKLADAAHAYRPAMPEIKKRIADLKSRGIYTVARMVVFKDNIMPRYNKALAVHRADGGVWEDHHKVTWLDPYNQDAWRYDLEVAVQAAHLGFDEVQFDYIRFPTDGNLKEMHFAKPYSKEAASHALVNFLHEASVVLHPLGVAVSIDVFGLTTTVSSGMGIGQVMRPMADQVDFVCPMIYPSHYARGEYGIPNPNDQPYRTVHLAIHDAIKALGPEGVKKLRPWLQDFSLKGRGIRYGLKQIRDQISAGADQGIPSWTFWNARCVYQWDALKEPIAVATPVIPPTTSTAIQHTPHLSIPKS